MASFSKRSGLFLSLPNGFPIQHPCLGQWLFHLGWDLARYKLTERVFSARVQSGRILRNRNEIAYEAIDLGARWLLMVDPDMDPDPYLGCAEHPQVQPFVGSSLAFLKSNPFSIIAAPAWIESPGKQTNVWTSPQDGNPGRRFTDAEAMQRFKNPAIERVPAIGTGLMLIDTHVFDIMPEPFFNDVYHDQRMVKLDMTQDVYFTSRANEAGVGVYCNWYAWCGHHKDQLLLPEPGERPMKRVPIVDDGYSFAEAAENGQVRAQAEAVVAQAPVNADVGRPFPVNLRPRDATPESSIEPMA